MNSKDLINWGELSRLLTGGRTNIRRNRIPKKHKEVVDNLLMAIESWIKDVEKSKKQENRHAQT